MTLYMLAKSGEYSGCERPLIFANRKALVALPPAVSASTSYRTSHLLLASFPTVLGELAVSEHVKPALPLHIHRQLIAAGRWC